MKDDILFLISLMLILLGSFTLGVICGLNL